MRWLSSAICTSGEPVSPSTVAYSAMIFFLVSASVPIDTSNYPSFTRCAARRGLFTRALWIRGRCTADVTRSGNCTRLSALARRDESVLGPLGRLRGGRLQARLQLPRTHQHAGVRVRQRDGRQSREGRHLDPGLPGRLPGGRIELLLGKREDAVELDAPVQPRTLAELSPAGSLTVRVPGDREPAPLSVDELHAGQHMPLRVVVVDVGDRLTVEGHPVRRGDVRRRPPGREPPR